MEPSVDPNVKGHKSIKINKTMSIVNNRAVVSTKGVLSWTSKSRNVIFAVVATVAILSFAGSTIELDKITSLFRSNYRRLSINLGDGKCKWTPPIYDVPENETFTKTLIAGYPSGDKRLTFVQMEALTGLSARDEWDFAFLVSSWCFYYIGECGGCIDNVSQITNRQTHFYFPLFFILHIT
jgi:hypothetical protein